jgi:hypothetical protein
MITKALGRQSGHTYSRSWIAEAREELEDRLAVLG